MSKRFNVTIFHGFAEIIRLFLRLVGVTSIEKTIHAEKIRLPIYGHKLRSILINRNYLESYEESYFDAVLDRVGSGDTVFDIGAFKGIYTVFIARSVGVSGKVVSFEPHPAHFSVLAETVKVNNLGNVVLVQKAVGSEVGTAKFWLAGPGSSMQTRSDRSKEIEVQVITVDQYVESTGHIPRILKVDVEGFEFMVLKGAKKTLGQCSLICCELHPAKMRATGHEPEQLLDYITKNGYRQVYEYIPLKHKQDSGRPYNVIFERTRSV